MIKKTFFLFLFILISFLFHMLWSIPAFAQYDIAGWWKVRFVVDQGDFVTGEWIKIHDQERKGAYVHIFQQDSNRGNADLIFWSPGDQRYFVESYDLYLRNNIVVLYIPTFYDGEGNPAASTIVLRQIGSTVMRGYHTLYDMEQSGSSDLFVRMGPVIFTKVNVNMVPNEVKQLIP